MFYDWNACWQATIASLLVYSIVHSLLSKLISHPDPRQRWKRVNIATSFFHSCFSAFVCIYVSVENPAMCTTDIISSFTRKTYVFISLELGYFIFDSVDMIRHSSNRQPYELIIHHLTIIACFGISLSKGQYLGYCVLSLFMEINSVFLHLRQLLIFGDMSKQTVIYRVNNLFNFSTFMIFRFGVVIYMSIWLFMNHSRVPLVLCVIGHTGLLIMAVINCNLLHRLIKSDLLAKRD